MMGEQRVRSQGEARQHFNPYRIDASYNEQKIERINKLALDANEGLLFQTSKTTCQHCNQGKRASFSHTVT